MTALTLGWSSTAQADDQRAGFGVVPARGAGVDERSFFSYSLTPGSVAYDKVAVVNYGTAPLTLTVAALDAFNTENGGWAVQGTRDRPLDLGAWIRLSDRDGTVRVPGRSSSSQPGTAVIPLTITVPADASPGDHGAGVVAVLRTSGRNPDGQNIDLEQRVATRVYVTVKGPVRPGLRVSELAAHYTGSWLPWEPGRVEADYSVVNTGNVRMGVHSTVTTAGPFGSAQRRQDGKDVGELLPHNEQQQSVRVTSVWPLLRTTVTITGVPLAASGAAVPQLAPVTRTITLWTIPPWLSVVAILLLAGVGLLVWRRRHPRPRGAHAPQRATRGRDPAKPRERVGAVR